MKSTSLWYISGTLSWWIKRKAIDKKLCSVMACKKWNIKARKEEM